PRPEFREPDDEAITFYGTRASGWRDRPRFSADPRADTGGRRRRVFADRLFRVPAARPVTAVVFRILPTRQHARRLCAEPGAGAAFGHHRHRARHTGSVISGAPPRRDRRPAAIAVPGAAGVPDHHPG